eukprot:9290870-Pyramimonas_sp.AAC.1
MAASARARSAQRRRGRAPGPRPWRSRLGQGWQTPPAGGGRSPDTTGPERGARTPIRTARPPAPAAE